MPCILSAVDVDLGGCFQARSILTAFAETRGAPRLSESGWDTAHSISCWPVSTRAGQPGLQPASTWLSGQGPARSREPGPCNRTFLEGQLAGTNGANRGAVLAVIPDSQACNGFSATFQHVVFAVLCLGGRVPRIRNARHCFKSQTLVQIPPMVPCHL